MKKIRFFFLLCVLSMVAYLGMISSVQADFSGFVDQLKTMNIPLHILSQTGITRYELTRLLNAVECKDCVNTDPTYTNNYSGAFWKTFSALPGKDFGDIKYPLAKYNQTNYYYCVAYVGDNEYMRGYPAATSPVCGGQFCGLRYTTKAEFLQVIINMISPYIYPAYALHWKNAYGWIQEQGANSAAYKTLTSTQLDLMNTRAKECGDQTCPLQNADEFNTYLKYCMYNLDACQMVSFGKIKEGYWPVAELNILYTQSMIDIDQAAKYNIGELIDGKLVVSVLSRMNEIIGCAFNNDYDCDGIINSLDSCPTTYSPHQKDTDHDGIGDVCDDDIDNDSIKNPIGIVDDNGRINVALWNSSMDNCLFVVNQNQTHSNGWEGDACLTENDKLSLTIAVQDIAGTTNKTVRFAALSKGSARDFVWDFGDGNTGSGQTVSHTYLNPGLYTVRLIAHGKSTNDALATTTVVIGRSSAERRGLSISSDILGGKINQTIPLHLTPLGSFDRFERDFGDGSKESSSQQTIKKIYRTPGLYPVSVKGYVGGEVAAVSVLELNIGDTLPGSFLSADTLTPDKDVVVNFQTNISHFSLSEIKSISWDFGDGTIETAGLLTMSHFYKTTGKKAIVETIHLSNGISLTNILTLYVVAPRIFDSYGLQFSPSLLAPRAFEKLGFTHSIIGSPLNTISRVSLSFDNGNSYIPSDTSKISLPFTQQYSYTDATIYYPQTHITVDECTTLSSEATLAVRGSDRCLQAKLDGTLKSYTCDLDNDKIPDICDGDIDGDKKSNLIGTINPGRPHDCDYSGAMANGNPNNLLNTTLLTKHFMGVCSLDNAPYANNPLQEDTNNNNIGDVMDSLVLGTGTGEDSSLSTDSDNDGISDYLDSCPTIRGDQRNGCPIIGRELRCENSLFSLPNWNLSTIVTTAGSCGDGGVDTNETCTTCPSDVGSCAAAPIHTTCGNKQNDPGETCKNCPTDIGACAATSPTDSTCGNKQKDPKETCENCPTDIGACGDSPVDLTCGNGQRDAGETCENCPSDIGACTPVAAAPDTCGNGIQDPGETCENCPADSAGCLIVVTQPCVQCPCPYSDTASNLTTDDQVQAVLWDAKKSQAWAYSPGLAIDDLLP